MSVVEESILKLLEQKAQENDSSPILKPKSFSWDAIIFSLAYAIFGLSISGIIVDFFKSGENSVACFYDNITLENRDWYIYINSYCYKELSNGEFFPLILVVQTASLIVPHHLWKVIFSTEFDSFFSHAAMVQILREPNTGQYPIKNYRIVNYLQREFACRRHIVVGYIFKLIFQLLLVIIMIIINDVEFKGINNEIIFECSYDEEIDQVFDNVTCANPRKPFINVLKITDYVLLGSAAFVLLIGLVRCMWTCTCVSEGKYETTAAKICYESCIEPQYYHKPSFKSSIRSFQMNNDFEFLFALLHFGYGRVFRTILIEKEISKAAVNDLQKLPQGN